MLALCGLAAVLTLLPLALIVFHLIREATAVLGPTLLTRTPAALGEGGGGVGNGLLGTLLLTAQATAIGLPIAVGAGLFLADAPPGRLPSAVRFASDVLGGVPSIVVGIFVWSWVVLATGRFSAFAGAVALAIMLIPTVTRTTEQVLRLVPTELREGGLALGMSRWRTTFGIVLPAASGGIVTGVLLGMARIAGETAPLLFTAFGNPRWSWRPDHPTASLPQQIFVFAMSPFESENRLAWAAALLLVAMVLGLSIAARRLAARTRLAG